MKVLIGSAYFESHRGGIEIVAGRLARELRTRGVDVTWLASDASPPPDAKAGAGKALPVSAWNITERRFGVPLPLPGPAGLAAIWREVASSDAVLLHDSLYPTNVAAMLAAWRLGKPVVLVQHIGMVPYKNPVPRVLMTLANRFLGRPMLAAANQVVFIAERVKQHLSGQRFAAPPLLIFNGVDTGVFRPPGPGFDRGRARAALGLPMEGPLVLFVGRFVEKKGLAAIEHLARSSPHSTIALAGWGPLDPRDWKLANVRVLSGLQGASLVPLYRSADVLILPSTGEGFPLVVQEALACGLPVICGTETAEADPKARAFLNAIEVDTADPRKTAGALAERIAFILADPARSGGHAAQARHAFVRERYGWAAAGDAYLGLLISLVYGDAEANGQKRRSA